MQVTPKMIMNDDFFFFLYIYLHTILIQCTVPCLYLCNFQSTIPYSLSKSSYINHHFFCFAAPTHSLSMGPLWIENTRIKALSVMRVAVQNTRSGPQKIFFSLFCISFPSSVLKIPRKPLAVQSMVKKTEATNITTTTIISSHQSLDIIVNSKSKQTHSFAASCNTQANESFRQMLERQTGCQAH